jgi:hypothetical protein
MSVVAKILDILSIIVRIAWGNSQKIYAPSVTTTGRLDHALISSYAVDSKCIIVPKEDAHATQSQVKLNVRVYAVNRLFLSRSTRKRQNIPGFGFP